MDYRLIRRRNKLRQCGTECWLVAFYTATGTTPLLAVTNLPGGVTLGDVTYSFFNLGVEEPPNASSDELPTGVLVLSNVSLELQQGMADNDYYQEARCLMLNYNTEELDADYSGDWRELQVVSHETTLRQVKFTLAVPKELVEPVPEDLYNAFSCRHRFRVSSRCGYVGKSVTVVTLTPGSPVSITIDTHGFPAAEYIEIEDSDGSGISPSLDGVYQITVVDANTFTLDGTDGGEYSGSYSGEMLAGFAYCEQTRTDCRLRGKADSFGGFPQLRSDGLTLVG